jgi:hypothetical protein
MSVVQVSVKSGLARFSLKPNLGSCSCCCRRRRFCECHRLASLSLSLFSLSLSELNTSNLHLLFHFIEFLVSCLPFIFSSAFHICCLNCTVFVKNRFTVIFLAMRVRLNGSLLSSLISPCFWFLFSNFHSSFLVYSFSVFSELVPIQTILSRIVSLSHLCLFPFCSKTST